MLDVSADQALAFRVAGHHLDRRVGAEEAVAAIGLQEYPPGWGALAALRARSLDPLPPDVVQVNSFRGSPYVVPRADARVFTAALVPEDEAGLKSLVGAAPAKEVIEEGYEVGEALALVAAAAREGLAGGPLDRDAFHQAMRERLPDGPAAVVPRVPEPPRAAGVLARARAAGGHRDAGEGDVGAGRAALDAARGRPRGAGAALPARVRAGDAHAARLVGADRAVAREAALRRECRTSWSRRPSRGGRGSCSPRTWSGWRRRRRRRASGCSAATTPTSRSPTARRSCRTPR